MKGKYKNVVHYGAAKLYRARVSGDLNGLVEWGTAGDLRPGCTAIIAMPHRLPDVLAATLRFLAAQSWDALVGVVVCVDCPKSTEFERLREQVCLSNPALNIEFIYYTERQYRLASKLNLPYVYSWLSWCIALTKVKTENFLIQDYDALLTSNAIAQRYANFTSSGVSFQGVSWYEGNGILLEDRLATTFEAFAKTDWVRDLNPIDLFNKIGQVEDRKVDFDTFLYAQQSGLKLSERAIYPMGHSDLVHPSQMIHQYTMFRRYPGKALPCFSIIHIPFFCFLGGNHNAIVDACKKLENQNGAEVELLGDGTRFNFEKLQIPHVDWALKQMLYVVKSVAMAPNPQIVAYGELLYDLVSACRSSRWINNFDGFALEWIQSAKLLR